MNCGPLFLGRVVFGHWFSCFFALTKTCFCWKSLLEEPWLVRYYLPKGFERRLVRKWLFWDVGLAVWHHILTHLSKKIQKICFHNFSTLGFLKTARNFWKFASPKGFEHTWGLLLTHFASLVWCRMWPRQAWLVGDLATQQKDRSNRETEWVGATGYPKLHRLLKGKWSRNWGLSPGMFLRQPHKSQGNVVPRNSP